MVILFDFKFSYNHWIIIHIEVKICSRKVSALSNSALLDGVYLASEVGILSWRIKQFNTRNFDSEIPFIGQITCRVMYLAHNTQGKVN